MKFVRVLISAPSKKEAEKIASELTQRNLVAGCLITKGEAQYWWNKKLVRRSYWNISAFSVLSLNRKIISLSRKLNSDEVPIITFYKIDSANEDFLMWIRQNTQTSPLNAKK